MRFQFSLRTLFAVVTIAAVACARLAHEYRVVQERKAILRWAVEGGGGYGFDVRYTERPSFVRRWLGDEPVTLIWLPQGTTDADKQRIESAFPDANSSPHSTRE